MGYKDSSSREPSLIALPLSPIDPSIYSSLLVPCFLPGVIHLMPVSLGLYPKGTYRTVLHYSLLIGIHVYVEG